MYWSGKVGSLGCLKESVFHPPNLLIILRKEGLLFSLSPSQEVVESDLPGAVTLLKNLQEQVSHTTPLGRVSEELALVLCASPPNCGRLKACIE